jgi:hypothetical protein
MNAISMSFEMMAHDLNFREPIANGLKFLTDKRLAKAIASVVGVNDYNVLINSFVDASNSVQATNNALINSDTAWKKALARTRSTVAVAHLVGNVSSYLKQFESIPFAMRRMGYVNAVKHLSKVAYRLKSDPTALAKFWQVAAEIDPSVRAHVEGYDENTRGPLNKMLPGTNMNALTGSVKKLKAGTIDLGMMPFSVVDSSMKAMFALAAYSQFMEGDVEGWHYDKVQALDPVERDHRAKVYVSSLLEQSLTSGTMIDKAYVQKQFPTIAEFMNDRRNTFNNILWMGRDVKSKVKKGEYFKAGTSAAASIMTLVVAGEIAKMATKIPGKVVSIVKGEKDDTQLLPESAQDFALSDIPSDLLQQSVGSVPVGSDVLFAASSDAMFAKYGIFGMKGVAPMNVAQQAEMTIKKAVETGIEYMDGRELSKGDVKNLLTTASYFTEGIPVKMLFMVSDAAEGLMDKAANSPFIPSLAKVFTDRFEDFKTEQAKLPKSDQISDEAMKELQNIEIQVKSQTEKPSASAPVKIPPGTLEAIKEAESAGDPFAKNDNSTAAGLYQFTDQTWKSIMQQAPDLGLTEDGRVSGNTAQQEKAMKWFTEQNIRKLKREGVAVNLDNIYAAHFLGVDKAVAVLKAPADTKLKTILSTKEMADNDFKKSMRVKDFKNWLKDRLNTGSSEDSVAKQ